ncbi:MAG: pyridoxal 5'-phosphate synthase glutaminase subunit PdxT [Solirubrobacterales bacterium]
MNVGFRGVGVLALQGGFAAHVSKLRALGALIREVRTPSDLVGLDGLVLPGGESTTMTLGIEREGLAEPITEFIGSGKPVLATCAGTIILDDRHLGSLDITCDRNAYGRQTHSFEADVEISDIDGGPFTGMFIRAPRITRIGEHIEVLATLDDHPVAVRHENLTALTFHPELTADDRLHRRFFESIPVGHLAEIGTDRDRSPGAAQHSVETKSRSEGASG